MTEIEKPLCREVVISVIAGASWIPCALPKGHEGGHRGKGNCCKHGEYLGEVSAFPQRDELADRAQSNASHNLQLITGLKQRAESAEANLRIAQDQIAKREGLLDIHEKTINSLTTKLATACTEALTELLEYSKTWDKRSNPLSLGEFIVSKLEEMLKG